MMLQIHSVLLTQLKLKEETYSTLLTGWLLVPNLWGCAFSTKRWVHFFLLFVPVTVLWLSALGVVGLALNLEPTCL